MTAPARSGVQRGGCRCGRHRLQVTTEPLWVSYCHCTDCRRSTGAPVSVFVGFAEEAVAFDGPVPSVHASSEHAERLFCAHCGTPIGYRDRRLENELYLMVGVLDEPERYVPARHAFVSGQLAWLHIADDLPRHARCTRERPRDAGSQGED